MPENYVGISDAGGDSVQINSLGALSTVTYLQSNPSITGAYLFSIEDQAGVVAANTFLTIFNPVGSTRNYATTASYVSCVATGASAAVKTMRAYRISASPTGGTLQAASSVCKLLTTYRDTNAEIRVGPAITATLQQPFSATPPPVTTGAGGSQFVHTIALPPSAPPFLVAPGQGVAFATAAGTTSQSWSLTIAWAEADA